MSANFTQSFKELAIKKALQRGSTSLRCTADDLGVGYSTLQTWLRQFKKKAPLMNTQKRPQDWKSVDKFQTLMETHGLNTEQLNQYCREKGLFPHQLKDWQHRFIQRTDNPADVDKTKLKSLKNEVKTLNKELNRKEKALAEMAALLILQKKFNALLEEGGK